jgi:hypothetical protein
LVFYTGSGMSTWMACRRSFHSVARADPGARRGETSPSFVGEKLRADLFPVDQFDRPFIDLANAALDLT